MLASRMVWAEPWRLSEAIFFDEARDVDVGGAGLHAGRVETEEAAVGFGDGGLRGRTRGAEVGEARGGGGRGLATCWLEDSGTGTAGAIGVSLLIERLGACEMWCAFSRWEETIMHHAGGA